MDFGTITQRIENDGGYTFSTYMVRATTVVA